MAKTGTDILQRPLKLGKSFKTSRKVNLMEKKKVVWFLSAKVVKKKMIICKAAAGVS